MKKRCDVLKRGLAILLTVSSLTGCGSSSEIPSGSSSVTIIPEVSSSPTPTARSSSFNTNSAVSSSPTPTARYCPDSQNIFDLGGLTIWLYGDAIHKDDTIEIISSGGVCFQGQNNGLPERSITIIPRNNPRGQVRITPRGTSGYVIIPKENVISLIYCDTGKIEFEFTELGISRILSAGESASWGDNYSTPKYNKPGSPQINTTIEEDCLEIRPPCYKEPDTTKTSDPSKNSSETIDPSDPKYKYQQPPDIHQPPEPIKIPIER